MKRDLRDPEKVGIVLRSLVKHQKVPVLLAADELDAYAIANYNGNPSCIEKYGRPGDHQPLWERIQIK
jgi:hypothetical protein